MAAGNPLVAFVRPAKAHNLRRVWEFAHKALGYMAVILAVPAIVLGLQRVAAATVLFAIYWVTAAVLLVSFLGLQYRTSPARQLLDEIRPLMGAAA